MVASWRPLHEKISHSDVSVADLIGDADPIKAATLKLPYSDGVLSHFGLIPRSHRERIFVINGYLIYEYSSFFV